MIGKHILHEEHTETHKGLVTGEVDCLCPQRQDTQM
jgi:hypothetical protein